MEQGKRKGKRVIRKPVRVYLCECGPIIKDALDLELLATHLAAMPEVSSVCRYPTLCSEEGRRWLRKDLAAHKGLRVVIAGCTPREHGNTFMEVCGQAGINPYLLVIANIREQCAWVTPDKEQALAKAELITRAAISRVQIQQPLGQREVDCNTNVLVIGGGVAGLTAARMLAGADHQVCLVECSPAIGGRSTLLADVYPNLECASCMLDPLLDEVLHHPNIEVLTYSEVEEVLGYFGNFTVRIRKRSRHVDLDSCYGCGTCHEACPVEVPRECDLGLSMRKAIHIPYTGALPNTSLIDEASCLHFQGQPCEVCVNACPFGNIELDMQDEVVERRVGAIIVATGAEFQLLNPSDLPQRVIPALMIERMLNSSGPTGGKLCLPGQPPPGSIALIHCIGDNGQAPAERCSKVCCMAMAKYVQQIHERLPGCELHRLLWEECAGGKGYREFTLAANRTPGLRQIHLAPGDRVECFHEEEGKVMVRYRQSGKASELAVDLAIIAPPLGGAPGIKNLSSLLRMELGPHDFVVEENDRLRSFLTRVDGVFVAGCAQGPKDIQESVTQGAASAGGVLEVLVPGRKLRIESAISYVDEQRCGGCRNCVVTCPYRAVGFDEERRVAEVNELLCRGCGSCAAGCPSGAMVARHFTDEQIQAEISALAV